jgi:hypothetical protein
MFMFIYVYIVHANQSVKVFVNACVHSIAAVLSSERACARISHAFSHTYIHTHKQLNKMSWTLHKENAQKTTQIHTHMYTETQTCSIDTISQND